MKKININEKTIILIILLILVILSIFVIKFKSSFNKKENLKEEFYPYQYFLNVNDVQNYFSNRQTLVVKESNTLLIGRNEKELKNGYYDIKFDINKDNVCIRINNLQKTDVEFKTISNEYLNELKQLLIDLFDYNHIDELINIIQEEYNKLRGNIECVANIAEYRKINIDKYISIFSIENNILKIDIKV